MATPSQQIADLLAAGKPPYQAGFQPINALAAPHTAAHPAALNQLLPEDYTPGAAQRAQEAAIANQNDLNMSGPNAGFWKALKAFQDHFGSLNAQGQQGNQNAGALGGM